MLRHFALVLLLPAVFAVGWWSHSKSELKDLSRLQISPAILSVVTDRSETHLSSARGIPVKEELADRSFDISNAKNRDSFEATIRGVPFSFLKQIYLERQDAEWKKTEEYYQEIPIDDVEGRKKQGDEFFKLFQRNSGGASTFFASTEWTLRGGKRVPVTFVAQIYSSQPTSGGVVNGWAVGDSSQGAAALATKGEELCYTVSAYFRVGESKGGYFATEGTGSCLNYVSARDGKPFVLFSNYSKALTPFFDRVSVPLPGFGTDVDSDPQWYDSNSEKWSRLARVRWEPISRDEYGRMQNDLQLDVIH